MLNKTIKPIARLIQNKTIGKPTTNLLFSLLAIYLSKEHYKEKLKRNLGSKFGKKDFPEKVWDDISITLLSMIRSVKRTYNRNISPKVISKISSILPVLIAKGTQVRSELAKKHGYSSTPAFVMVSPTNICNLKCLGCYAGENYNKHILDFDIFDWIINEMKEKLATRFFVISGGEPFAYKSKGKTILDIFAKYNDCFFLVFTNGTLITKKIAAKLEKLGNVTPAISIEGFKEETDARRGEGVYDKIIETMKNLREKGIIFGISATPMKHNANLLLSDDFIKFWFDEQGATYGWYFQYMPIGRNPKTELLVTPEQRARMWKKAWQHVRNGYFIADFWNCGTMSRGCISSAKDGGYFHILWNGDITPCGFIPFKDKNKKLNNVYSLKKNKKSIVNAINSPLFKEIREWQRKQQEYARDNKCGKCKGYGCGNLLMPCPIRDNSLEFDQILKKTKALPFDDGAVNYKKLIRKGIMPSYNDLCREKMDFLWREYYINNNSK